MNHVVLASEAALFRDRFCVNYCLVAMKSVRDGFGVGRGFVTNRSAGSPIPAVLFRGIDSMLTVFGIRNETVCCRKRIDGIDIGLFLSVTY